MAGMQDLSTMFANGDFGLLDRGLQAQRTGQEKAGADLAAVLQKTQQDADMHPLDLQAKAANTGLVGAQTRNQNALAQTHEDQNKLFASIPMDKRVDAWMTTELKNKSAAELERLKSHIGAASQIAASALANGGHLPLNEQSRYSQSHPELLEYLKQPNGANILANMVTKFESMQADRLKSDAAHASSAAAQRYSADRAADSRAEVARLNAEAAAERAALKAAYDNNPIHRVSSLITQRMEALFAAEQATDPAAKATNNLKVQQLDRQIAAQSAAAALQAKAFAPVGGVDLTGATKGQVATNPVPDLVPKDGGPKASMSMPSQADLEFTAKKHGITVEQVKQKLGIK